MWYASARGSRAVADTDPVPQGTLSAEQMRDILLRLASDHYQRSSDAADAVARGVRHDLELCTSGKP